MAKHVRTPDPSDNPNREEAARERAAADTRTYAQIQADRAARAARRAEREARQAAASGKVADRAVKQSVAQRPTHETAACTRTEVSSQPVVRKDEPARSVQAQPEAGAYTVPRMEELPRYKHQAPVDQTAQAQKAPVPDNQYASVAYAQQVPAGQTSGYQPGQYQKPAAYAEASKKKKAPWRVVAVIASVVLVCSLVAIGVICFSYWQGQDKYSQVRQIANLEISDKQGEGEGGLAGMSVDWAALRETNSDVVAWIYMPDTQIDYPVVQTKDNEYYLNHAFDGSQNWLASYGTIFMDYTNNSQFRDSCNFLYGHHMNDGTMFAFLDKLTNQEAFDNNRTIYILTPDGNYRLKTFAMVVTTGSDMIVETNFASAAAMDAYVQDKIDRSVVDAGADKQKALDATKIFGMSTCDYSREDGRAILFSYVAESTVSGVKGVEQ